MLRLKCNLLYEINANLGDILRIKHDAATLILLFLVLVIRKCSISINCLDFSHEPLVHPILLPTKTTTIKKTYPEHENMNIRSQNLNMFCYFEHK